MLDIDGFQNYEETAELESRNRLQLTIEEPVRLISLCPAAESMLNQSIDSGMFMTINTPELRGVVKFAGSLAMYCTESTDPNIVGKWLLPAGEITGSAKNQVKVLQSIFERGGVDLQEVLSSFTWKINRTNNWIELPDFSELIESSDLPVIAYLPEGVESYMDYVSWRISNTELGCSRYDRELALGMFNNQTPENLEAPF